jgi:hypothetical protein
MAQNTDISSAYSWVLYLDKNVHIDEYKLVKNANLESFIFIQDVKQLKSRPAWLSTLPALVDTQQKLAYRGPTCIKRLVSIELPPEHLKRLAKKTKSSWDH